MKHSTDKPDIRFVVETTTDSDYSHFYARAVYLVDPEPSSFNPNDSGVRNPMDSDFNPFLPPLAYFTITAQASKGDPGWYGFHVGYREPFHVELAQAERMVKLLRKVTRNLDKLNNTFGYVEDLAAYCGRVASAVGVTSKHPFGFYSKELNMSGTHYKWTNVDGLRSQLPAGHPT